MIKISLQALVKILIDKDIKFIIEKSKYWTDEYVAEFVTNIASQIRRGHIYGKEENIEKIRQSRFDISRGLSEVALHYSFKDQRIISISQEWSNIIHEKIQNAKKTQKVL